MTWGRTSDHADHKARSRAIAYESPAGLPFMRLGQTGRWAARHGRTGSRGGAPIWIAREAWMPDDGLKSLLRLSRNTAEKNGAAQRGAAEPERNEADQDGFADMRQKG